MEKVIQRTKHVIMQAEVEIRGLKPLLMSSPKEMYLTEIENPFTVTKLRGKKVDPKAEAEKRAYRTENHGWTGDLCIPAKCIQRNIEESVKLFEARTASGKKKRGGISLVQQVKGSVQVEPEFIPIFDSEGKKQIVDYEVNADKVKISATKGSVIRYRPEIPDWSLKFRVRWNASLYGLSESTLEELFHTAGYLGLLDYRPKFGIYELTRFDVVE